MTAHLRRRAGAIALAGVLGASAFALATPAASAAAAPTPPGSAKQLDKQDRELLAEAERAGKPTVTLVVAAEPGRTDQAAQQLRDLGGVVQTAAKDVDYIKVEVPRGKAEKAAELGAVKSVDVDGLIKQDDPRPEGTSAPLPQKAPGKDTPRVNPYLPTGDTGAAQFAQQVPKWDGRGATVAILDSGIDLDTPALAKTTTGERKIVDWYNANSTDSGDGTWVAMSKTRYTGKFTAGGRTWTAPATGGPYTVGTLAETAGDLRGGELAGDLNRDGDKTDSFGVLQDVTTKEVRVDVDGDGDFTNNAPMIDYKVAQQVGHLGPVPFVVQTDRSIYDNGGTALVNIGIAGAAHGTHVSGIVAGNSLFGGKMAGAAPGAKLMAVKVCLTSSSCTASGLIDGLLYAARNGADAINISIGGLPALNDGNNARADLYNRTIAQYNVQVFISAGNSGAGANTVGDPSVATDAISVGSYITDATWLSNYGSVTAAKQGLHPFSSRGPAENGGFKPDIVAPGSAISTIPGWQPGGPVAGTFPLPNGYAMFNGTSMAAPQAAGAAALLISAYKATHHGQRPPVAALREAIKSTAKFVPGVGAYEQGAGLLDVSAAFHRLQDNVSPVSVTATVPVNTVLAGQLKTPGQGVGIYDREGVTAGKSYTRTYTLTRTSGPNRNTRYDVQWTGNDGTFRSAGSVVLPLNKPVAFDVKIDPRGEGVHSALLKVGGTTLLTLNTVIAVNDFTAANGYSLSHQANASRNESTSVFVRVPAGASALKVDLAASTGQVRFLRNDPTGVPLDSNASTSCYLPDAGAGCAGGTPTSRTVVNPMPGVWEIAVEARRTSDAAVIPFTLTTSLIGTKISPEADTIASAPLGSPVARSYSVSNQLAAITGRLTGGPLGSSAVTRPTIANGAVQTFDVTVPAGATSFTARTGNPADRGADIDMIVYDCTGGSCVQAGTSGGSTAEEQVTIANPAAGLWRVEIDGYAVPAGSTAYDYSDTYVAPSLGAVTVNDTTTARPSGSSWTVTGAVTAGAQPGAGRVLRGELTLVLADGAVVGRSSVIVQSVG
ncbi:S8 family serine peptidase [Kutzneria sp. NPDC052558]|uniref:S8 family serine peptidase n=1 Tax=Kutzneria sp. NPDC052558 TaxID=3364121 RepID=UPI0037CB4D16